ACRDFCLFRHGKTPLDIMADCQTGVQKFDCLRDVGKRGKYNEKAKSAQAAEEDRGSKIEDRGSRVEDRGSKITLSVITRSLIFYDLRLIETPPLVVMARMVWPPPPRSNDNSRLTSPCNVIGKSVFNPPLTVPVSRWAE